MRTLIQARRLVAFLCLAVLLVAALTPATSGPLCAILVPLWLFFAAIVIVSICLAGEDYSAPLIPLLSLAAPRAPPIR